MAGIPSNLTASMALALARQKVEESVGVTDGSGGGGAEAGATKKGGASDGSSARPPRASRAGSLRLLVKAHASRMRSSSVPYIDPNRPETFTSSATLKSERVWSRRRSIQRRRSALLDEIITEDHALHAQPTTSVGGALLVTAAKVRFAEAIQGASMGKTSPTSPPRPSTAPALGPATAGPASSGTQTARAVSAFSRRRRVGSPKHKPVAVSARHALTGYGLRRSGRKRSPKGKASTKKGRGKPTTPSGRSTTSSVAAGSTIGGTGAGTSTEEEQPKVMYDKPGKGFPKWLANVREVGKDSVERE